MTDLGAAEPGGSGTEPAPKDDFGTHLQDFYIALRGGDPYVLSDAMGSLEHVAANERTRVGLDCSETLAMQDVVLDCQKKCAQALRSRVADNVSTLLAASRKKLRAKISKDMESSTLHNQRHINSMLELFGDWSDMVAGIVNGGLSDKVKSLVIVPFHVRVMEVSFECFEQFKSDKNISNWLKRVSDPLEQMNLISLDLILVQLAGMRELTMQYQSFLIDTCGLVDLSLAEFDSWKELDIVYCALDYAYIGLAISEAVADSKKSLLLCVEDNRPVYVLQGVEDAFFVIRKVVDRAISTGSDMILFSVINRVMELLGHDRDSLGKSGNSSVTLLQTIVSMRPYYRAILRLMKQSKREAVLEKGPIPVASKADSNNDEALEMTEAMINSKFS